MSNDIQAHIKYFASSNAAHPSRAGLPESDDRPSQSGQKSRFSLRLAYEGEVCAHYALRSDPIRPKTSGTEILSGHVNYSYPATISRS